MRLTPQGVRCLSESEIQAIVDTSLNILDEIGMIIESPFICQRFVEAGAAWDGQTRLKFPRSLMRRYIESQRRENFPAPVPREPHVGGSIGSYPMRYLDPYDRTIKLHTARSVADLTRLADAVPNIDGIGSCGVPSDISPLLQPLWMRFISWRYAEKLSNSYVLWDHRLCPLIAEFAETVSAMEPQNGGVKRYFRGENYIITPLRYAREEALQFEWFYQHGYRVTVGNLPSIGGSAPSTMAGAVALGLAESLVINFWQHVFYGDKGLYVACAIPPLDMRTGCMPYGRPEQTLTALAMSQIADAIGALDTGSTGHGTAAKGPNIEAGLNKGFGAGMQLALFGDVDWHFGIFSTDEIYDPRLILIENEFVDSLRRISRGFEVTPETLAYDVIREVGAGGQFLSHPHTHEHFRQELWLPDLFNGMYMEGWMAAGRPEILERARDKVLDILASHHPRGIKPETEEALLSLMDKYAAELNLTDYVRPTDLPK